MIVVTLCSLQAWPQTPLPVRVKGRITDKDSRQPLAYATVALLYAKDSSLAASAFTDSKGMFLLEGVGAGSYQVYITYLGYQPLLRAVTVTATDTVMDLGMIVLHGTGVNLKTVEIVQIRSPMVIKKDTLEFNAAFYKTRENAVMEELLKKLPGIKIAPDGTITVNGEIVKRILVDGKPFFGDDPKLATRNLPADMIDKVQLIDKKSDLAQFTGIDDGKREKAINITVKRDRKGKFLGRVAVGYGTGERFAGSGNLNQFSEGEQLSILGGANNVNNAGFLEGSGQGPGGGGNGITRSWSGGVNYSKDISEKLKLSGSYVINDSRTENERSSARQNLLPDTSFYYNQDAYSVNNNASHYLDTRAELRPDSMHLLTLESTFRHAATDNFQESLYESLGGDRQLVNSGTMRNTSNGSAPSFHTSLSFAKKFHKLGRALKSNLTYGYNTSRQEGYNRSYNLFVVPGGDIDSDTLDQRNDMNSRHNLLSLYTSFTEPLFKDHFLELVYVYRHNHTLSNKLTYDYDNAKKIYDRLNDSLSNSFENTTNVHLAGMNIHARKSSYYYYLGFSLQFNGLNNYNISEQERLNQYTANFAPFVVLDYAFTNNKRLHFTYSGGALTPNAAQLQPVPDNSNPLYIKLGNPDLKPAFLHSIVMDYKALNPATAYAFTASINTAITKGKIVEAIWSDSLGRQVSQPQNVDGAYNVNANLVNTFPLKKLQTAINLNTTLGFKRDINYINSVKGNMDNYNITQGLSFNYTYKQLFDIGLAGNVNYNGVRYALQKDNNTNYFNYSCSLNGNINLPLGFSLGGNLDYWLNTGRAAGYNQDVTMLNAFISKSLFQKKAQVKLQGFDLLNRNVSISRNVGESYIEDVQTKVLQRFFMLSFSYFFKPDAGQ